MKSETSSPAKQPASWPKGFQASGVHCGIKAEHPDLGLLVSDTMASVAGTFTTNQVQAAPVRLCRSRLSTGHGRAIVVNSGNANACTGAQGQIDAEAMARLTAAALGVDAREVYVCSTGHIGQPLPMPALHQGIPKAAAALSPDEIGPFATAILTTDTSTKIQSERITVDGVPVLITGVAKGAGMIEPMMATMLAFIATDAAVPPAALQQALSTAVNLSFNRITVDGDRSTNDTVLMMANGRAGNTTLQATHPAWGEFLGALNALTLRLALSIVRDGEGATRVVTVHVKGARSQAEAEAASRAIGNSSLIKTSWAGGQANWGRLMDAIGYSSAKVVEDLVEIDYDGIAAVRAGIAAGTPASELDRVAANDSYTIEVRLNLGSGEAVIYSCDTTEEYVRINVEE